MQIMNLYGSEEKISEVVKWVRESESKIGIDTLIGSSFAYFAAAVRNKLSNVNHLIIMPDKESAAYTANDLEEILGDTDSDYAKKTVLFYPARYKKPYGDIQRDNVILRTETLNRINNGDKVITVTYPGAFAEKIVARNTLNSESFVVRQGDALSVDTLIDVLDNNGFQRMDFVVKSGEYAIRGGIIDVFSYSFQKPARIEMSGDIIESIRLFDIVSQMSVSNQEQYTIVPDLGINENGESSLTDSLFSYLDSDTIIWTKELSFILQKFEDLFSKAEKEYTQKKCGADMLPAEKLFLKKDDFLESLKKYTVIESGGHCFFDSRVLKYDTQGQPVFNGNFELLTEYLQQFTLKGYNTCFFVKDIKQQDRIERILREYVSDDTPVNISYHKEEISQGFVDNEQRVLCFTDHQLFNRYHRYRIQDNSEENMEITLDDITALKPGDYVVHIDYGVGMFSGLEKIDVAGRQQEAIRLLYKDNDVLYVSVHSLHKISRYYQSEGVAVKLNKLGSSAWTALKQKTKNRVKDIAKDLIKLYAERKSSAGFGFSPDTYLQNELEASFMYEDTPDQSKAMKAIKSDMEKSFPMDRLICGDVGFGKTELAIRAAFKAVCDSKQVAVLVPTTILAFQHWQTFSLRLKNMPCRVDYINRFRTAKEKKAIAEDLKSGKIDILIGTHKIVGKDIEFKDLGLLIIDEEQKFGVSVKEKLRQMKVNVDTLTLTATPIPRTLQFSLMGARDLSVINTPPANRQPIVTEVSRFDREIIRDAVVRELDRGGQVYFVNNRIQNIYEVSSLLQSLIPQARICVGHGQMKGEELEKIMVSFINGEYDVLVATSIVENGIDIPNANTIIINDAQNYGLSDLHQLRGRVGRSNKRAYCYLLVPTKEILTEESRKRLNAIEELSSVGSGFAVAMRDLDIRGAGNILGAEQSGFISDIGYEMYNKILVEALSELREDSLNSSYAEETDFVKDNDSDLRFVNPALIETDLEILIPDTYVSNVAQRIKIYKRLDSITREEDLEELARELKDRFGVIPQQTLDLFDIVRIRRQASVLRIEKIILKRGKMILNFPAVVNMNKEYFNKIMLFVSQYSDYCRLMEKESVVQLQVSNIQSVHQAKKIINYLIK